MRNLAGKRALVTGAGHGLGRELARVFAASGVEVIATDRQLDTAEETARLIHALGGRATAFAMDITDQAAVRDVRERIGREHGPLDLLINNAGIVHGGPFLDVPLAGHLATYEVNTKGPVIVTHAFLPDLIGRPEAHLVNIASASGFIALPFATTYAASKWAVIGFTESIREELRMLGHSHVQVTAVCPSYIQTGMCDGAKPPTFSQMLAPQRVAGEVLQAVRRNRELVLTPWLVTLTPFWRGVLPRSWFRAVCYWSGVTTSLAAWRNAK
jgi:short-subunit dehydrogenase